MLFLTSLVHTKSIASAPYIKLQSVLTFLTRKKKKKKKIYNVPFLRIVFVTYTVLHCYTKFLN